MRQDEDNIKRLQKELYAKDEGDELVMRRRQLGALGKRLAPGKVKDVGAPVFADVALSRARKRRRAWLMAGGLGGTILIFIAAFLATAWFRSSRQVKDEQIGIAVQGPTDLTAGEEISYTIAYENSSRVDWNTVDLVVSLPEGFRVTETVPGAEGGGRELTWRLGNLERGKKGSVLIKGRLIGEQGAVSVTQAEITLSPENFPSGRFSKSGILTTTIAALPVDISVEAAGEAGSGERIRGVIQVRNAGANVLENAVLKLVAQPGVELALEDPEFSSGFEALSGEWNLEAIPALGEATRTIIFTVAGTPGERRSLEISVGVRENEKVYLQRTVNHVVAISASELTVTQEYNGSSEPQAVFPEGDVKARVRYANVGTIGMRNVIVKVQFEGTGLDAKTLDLANKGAYDPKTNAITWTSASVPELSVVAPREGGGLEYNFKILPATTFPSGKNFTLVSTATVDSDDLPVPVGQSKKVISDRAVLSIGTQLTPEVMAFYDDGRLGIKSEGPEPPQVGETTTYTIRVHLGSALNDVGETRVVAVLPEAVGYTGKTITGTGSVDFNDRSREVIWSIPLLEGLTGRTKPAAELFFQVSVTPGANLENKVIPLLRSLTADGQDVFIDELVSAEIKELPTVQVE